MKKGETGSIYDNTKGYMYEVSSRDTEKYDQSLKPYTYELMKIWFGSEYEYAKSLHDEYLGYSLNGKIGKQGFYIINGRQVYIAEGLDSVSNGFTMKIWVKDAISMNTLHKN